MKKVKVVYTTLRVEVPLNKNPNLLEYWLKGSPIFSEFMENSAKFMKNSGLKASSSESLPVSVAALRKPYTRPAHVGGANYCNFFCGLSTLIKLRLHSVIE